LSKTARARPLKIVSKKRPIADLWAGMVRGML
jgi:hypothetical protein